MCSGIFLRVVVALVDEEFGESGMASWFTALELLLVSKLPAAVLPLSRELRDSTGSFSDTCLFSSCIVEEICSLAPLFSLARSEECKSSNPQLWP